MSLVLALVRLLVRYVSFLFILTSLFVGIRVYPVLFNTRKFTRRVVRHSYNKGFVKSLEWRYGLLGKENSILVVEEAENLATVGFKLECVEIYGTSKGGLGRYILTYRSPS
ncbi:hypothetical protein GQ53DRAFT_767868 [Thozetella sp. PMI_491]|nr:hypothetical protein GQ53DRAFT_767868 [Thozetella sp. PMI_491]